MRRGTAFTLAGAALALSAAVVVLWTPSNRRQSPAIPAAAHHELAGVGQNPNIGLQTPTVVASDLAAPAPFDDDAGTEAPPATNSERTPVDAARLPEVAAAGAEDLVMRFPDGGEK